MNEVKVVLGTFILFFQLFIQDTVSGQKRQNISLNEEWIVKSMEGNEKIPKNLPKDFKAPGNGWYLGSVPKQVQEFILEKGELPDPHFGDNAAQWVPVFQKDWLYCKRFITPATTGKVELCLLGLDTGADVIINGKMIAYCNNMHKRWRIPVEKYLNEVGKSNTLLLRFYSVKRMISKITAEGGSFKIPTSSRYIRKSEYDFANALGANPNFLKMGIFDDVYLDILSKEYFGNVYVHSELTNNFSEAQVMVSPDISGEMKSAIMYELISPSGQTLAKSTINSCESFRIPVKYPELWWPLSYGSQPLYKLKLHLQGNKGIIDEKEVLFGIRDIHMELKDEKTGESRFGFRINGRLVFMHGVNMTQLEGFTHVWNEKRAAKLLDLAKLGNFNFIRIHGKGRIPDDTFFERCDKDGIIVWMDFMTGSGISFPIDNALYLENLKSDIKDEIIRLRNFTSLGLWCGGNEHFLSSPSNSSDKTKPLGRELIQKIMPELVNKYDPQRYFHPSSPWGGDNWPNGNYPLEGDWHDYSTYKFFPAATVPLFASEIGMASPYSLHNMKRSMPEEEIWPEGFQFKIDKPGKIAWPDGWEKHCAMSAFEKIGDIQNYCDIQNVEDAIRVFGTAHGQYLKDRYERQRRGVIDGQSDGNRRSWGAAIWRLNDAWPMIYMSVVDYYLEPKIPYYFLKRACNPVLVSFEQTPDKICTWVVNDSPETVNDSLFIELWTFAGKMKNRIARKVDLPSGASKRIADLTFEFYEIGKRDEFLVARMGSQVVSHLLWPEKYLKLKEAEIKCTVINNEIILSSSVFVKDVAFLIPGTSGAIFGDNYFNLIPGETKKIKIIDSKGGKTLEIKGLNSSKITLNL
ncbi:MAG: glycoside hydrolase family 2 protein [Prolixibacteraceae bacterium]